MLVLIGIAYLIWFSGAFDIESVEVNGEDLAPGFSLEGALGENILFWQLDFDASMYSQVAKVEVDKQILDRRVVVNLSAKERYAIWCLEKQQECFWIDDSGGVFTNAPDLKGPLVFKLVRDFSDRDLGIGDQALEQDLFINLKAAFNFLDDLEIPTQELRIENLNFREAIAYTSEGPQIYFSLQDDPFFGKEIVKSLRASGEWSILNYLDLRVPGRAFYSQ